MARRVWIVSKDTEIIQAVIDQATANNCPEIASGIPPALEGIIAEGDLPCAYEEPTPPEPEPPRSTHISTIDAIDTSKARPVRVKRTWEGKDYFYDCLVTESVKDQYLVGDIAVGDYVIVFWSDVGEQIVTAKVFKSW